MGGVAEKLSYHDDALVLIFRPQNSPSDLKKIQNLKKCRHDVRYTHLPPSPDAPSAAVANDEVALTLLPPPSPIPTAPPPASHQCAGVVNLF